MKSILNSLTVLFAVVSSSVAFADETFPKNVSMNVPQYNNDYANYMVTGPSNSVSVATPKYNNDYANYGIAPKVMAEVAAPAQKTAEVTTPVAAPAKKEKVKTTRSSANLGATTSGNGK